MALLPVPAKLLAKRNNGRLLQDDNFLYNLSRKSNSKKSLAENDEKNNDVNNNNNKEASTWFIQIKSIGRGRKLSK